MEEKVNAWVARDEDGRLFIFFKRPKKYEIYGGWHIEAEGMWGISEELTKDLFSQVKWEDEEPTKVELIIKIK